MSNDKAKIAMKSDIGIGIHYEGSDTSGPFDEVRGLTVYHDEEGNPIEDADAIALWEANLAAKQECEHV